MNPPPPNNPNQQNASEVLTRRLNNFRRLSNIFKDEYWYLIAQLRNSHREYVALGLNPFQPQPQPQPDNYSICAFQGCQTRPMPLTPFCFAHILSDPRQVLYKPCEFVIARSFSILTSFFYIIFIQLNHHLTIRLFIWY